MHISDRDARTTADWLAFAHTTFKIARGTDPASLVELRRLFRDELAGTAPQETADMIGVRAASRLLCCTERQVRNLATALDGTRISGRWVFDRAKVEEYARTPHRRRYRKFPRTE
jgi:hypothetical protein